MVYGGRSIISLDFENKILFFSINFGIPIWKSLFWTFLSHKAYEHLIRIMQRRKIIDFYNIVTILVTIFCDLKFSVRLFKIS
jgi:hypothetical protein